MSGYVSILGVPFSRMTLDGTVGCLAEQINKETSGLFHLITANPEITLASQSDPLLQEIIRSADLVVPDGIGIVLAAKRKGEPVPERVTGYDLLLRLLAQGNEQGWSFYFLGTDERTSVQAAEQIVRSYPQVKLAGRHHGFFSAEDEPGIIADIWKSKPDVLILAMGAPYSDKWLHKHRRELEGVKLAFGVGGSLDVISGKVKPAPAIWKKLNLEWAHRLLFAPVAKGQKSRWRRQAALPKFVYRTMIRKGN